MAVMGMSGLQTYNPKTGNTTPAGTSGMFNLDDLTSRQYQGLPSWATPYLKSALASYWAPAMSGVQSAIGALNQAPRFINQQRVLANRQYNRGIGAATAGAVGDAMDQAIAKGTAGSSMLGDTMDRIGGQLAAGAQGAHNASNLWAAGANLGTLKDRLSANLSMAALMNDLINASKYSSSTNPMNPAALGLGLSPT